MKEFIANKIHIDEIPLQFLGMQLGTRMTVIKMKNNSIGFFALWKNKNSEYKATSEEELETTIKIKKPCIGRGETKKEAEHEVSKKTLIILNETIMP